MRRAKRPGVKGSSPRVRGKPADLPEVRSQLRLIPACAGKTCPPPEDGHHHRAHPRVCGENVTVTIKENTGKGSSPRVRGKRPHSGSGTCTAGLIPACAGKTSLSPSPGTPSRAHPRVCGENPVWAVIGISWLGSSPRVRGKPERHEEAPAPAGLIPACAGKTALWTARSPSLKAHPRVCGENWSCRRILAPRRGSSPRVRGKHRAAQNRRPGQGLIPACAGKTRERL